MAGGFCVVVCFEDRSRQRFVLVRHSMRGWELPGGRLEEGEEPLEAARREFEEETGRELRSPGLVRLGDVPWTHVVTGFLGGPAAPRAAKPEAVVEWRLVGQIGRRGTVVVSP
jgi:8-oxo-dGTP pyrophosphatase MutT (NUDIX family)